MMIRLEMKNCYSILTEKQQKNQHYHLEKLINMNILQVKKYYLLIKDKAKFTHSPFGRAFKKQIKTIKDQGQKQIKPLQGHGKQLVKSSSEKESLKLSKQKEIFEEFGNERINDIQNLSNQIDFNNLV